MNFRQILRRDDVSLLSADETVFTAVVDGWRAQTLARGNSNAATSVALRRYPRRDNRTRTSHVTTTRTMSYYEAALVCRCGDLHYL
ncbi:hypothetical protein FHT40_006321 [Mycolicibacterium sp. BK556]|nr:hypothetical protein [Mycolicibacterium sp. BK556]MBB3636123.1 hypothetical protein [Mycolicibacterium sp. BK607]MBB3753751.1 hypothetical protein [Mycolicibacterium sp. BK634]